ncbi:MAG: YfcE family phosphodiesterase [Desulfurococcaceae archaeon]
MSILVIGDTHIPDRAETIPFMFKNIIEEKRIWDTVIFTGDLTGKEVLDWVKNLGRRVVVVRGNMDYLALPRTQTIVVEGLRIGVHHGDGVYPRGDIDGLTRIAKQIDANILVSGHTHSPFVKIGGNGAVLLINPGSLTGVWGGGGGSMKPSFMTLDVSKDSVVIEIYELDNDVYFRKLIINKYGGMWVYE